MTKRETNNPRITVTDKIKYHSEGWAMYLLNSFLLFSTLWLITTVADEVYQNLAPTSWYFSYSKSNPVVPLTSGVEAGKYPIFISNSVYNTGLNMEWEDTLVCLGKSGDEVRLATQMWSAYQKRTTSPSIWRWSETPISSNYSECWIDGTATATTSRGYAKTVNYKSSPFFVIGVLSATNP